jgi:V/A-type H+-transporting ATPase subunit B
VKENVELLQRQYLGTCRISGPLLFVEGAGDLPFNSIVEIVGADGRRRGGQVIEVAEGLAVVQVFEETIGLDVARTRIALVDRQARLAVSEEMIGRVLNGAGRPLDGLPEVVPEERLPIAGMPMNPVSRARPRDYVHTGISAIDGFNTLVRGQKLPIFSGSGLPANEIAARILQRTS